MDIRAPDGDMMGSEIAGANIRRLRIAKGWSQEELAARSNTSQSTVNRIELGQSPNSRGMRRIVAALGTTMADIDPELTGKPSPATPIEGSQRLPLAGRTNEQDLPVYSTIEDNGFVIRSAEPVNWARRPSLLARVPNAYALYIAGECMSPELEPGDLALVNPNLPPAVNATHIFYSFDEASGRAAIRRLVRTDGVHWHWRCWQAPRGSKADETHIRRKDWPVAHRILKLGELVSLG